MIRLAFRLDDPSATSKRELEEGIIQHLSTHSLKASFAVIPFRFIGGEKVPLTSDRASHMVDASRRGILEIAQHGYSHTRNVNSTPGKPSEFVGLGAVQQLALIGEGKNLLEGVFGCEVNGFVPPWNSLDAETLTAVRQLGFGYVSAGCSIGRPPKGLSAIPITCRINEVEQAVSEARSYLGLHTIVVSLMHHYDFAEAGEPNPRTDLARFEALLEWVSRQPDLDVVTLAGMATSLTNKDRLNMLRYQRWKNLCSLLNLGGTAAQRCFPIGTLWELVT